MIRILGLMMATMLLLQSCGGSKKAVATGDDKPEAQKVQTENIHFYTGGTLTEVIDRAKKEDKLVFLYLTASWCAPCKFMEEEVYTYPPLYNMINENFISYELDIDNTNGADIAFLYNVKTVPGLVFLDTKGRMLVKKEGSLGKKKFMDLAQKALDKNKR